MALLLPQRSGLCLSQSLINTVFVKSQSVKHVILTSSIAAVTFNGRLLTPKAVVDDTWFFDHELCKESKSWYWYVLSKTLAEDAAWKFAKKKKTINPAMEKKPYSDKVAKLKAEYEKDMESYNAAEIGGENGEGEGEHEEG
ncbi:phenylacetaldehyde reductase-like [Arachis stenosperma]|uniref:phenylacetaldehyde reductase-like n=1 Tax=Arachis stenosperma TaxID=217475 RepID=UPI0025AB80E8|nr:phenylacetaldehyde reductase-like [Arachis stenosperma]